MYLCSDVDACACVFGFWSWLPALLPIETEDGEGFKFIRYEGSWWHGFQHWWSGE